MSNSKTNPVNGYNTRLSKKGQTKVTNTDSEEVSKIVQKEGRGIELALQGLVILDTLQYIIFLSHRARASDPLALAHLLNYHQPNIPEKLLHHHKLLLLMHHQV